MALLKYRIQKTIRVQHQPVISIVVFVFLLVLFFSCAKIVAPDGGPKDTEAPKLIDADPIVGSVLTKPNEIVLNFDEYVQIGDLTKIQINPYISKLPDIYLKQKKLIIDFKAPLRDSMTYSINFNNEISDLNEKNIYKDLEYVFATGDHIDSLTYTGVVVDAIEDKPINDVIVGLYANLGIDSLFQKEPPLYYDRTDSSGRFVLKYLRNGDYLLRALVDANSNLYYDQNSEKIGFRDAPLQLVSTDTLKENLRLFSTNEPKWTVLNKIAGTYGYYEIIMNKKGVTPNIEIVPRDSFYTVLSEHKDTLRMWYNPSLKDTFSVSLMAEDTIPYSFKVFPVKNRKVPDYKFMFRINLSGKNTDYKLWYNDTLTIVNPIPIVGINPQKISLKQDSIPLNFEMEKLAEDFRAIKIKAQLKANQSYILQVLPEAFTDIYGKSNTDTSTYNFITGKPEDFGSLVIKPDSLLQSKGYFAELEHTTSKKIIKLVLNDTILKLENLKPSSFKMKIIVDENRNEKWDTGSYNPKKQPEKIIVLKQDVVVRTSFETLLPLSAESLGLK
jgi:hypothetical protein